MKFNFFIAFRYFFSKKKKNIINIISWVAFTAVTFVAAATIIIMSSMNGMDSFVRELLGTFDSDLTILPKEGKSFEITPELNELVTSTEGVKSFSEIIEDNALLKYRGSQSVVKIKGINSSYLENHSLDTCIIKGSSKLEVDSFQQALVGIGIFDEMRMAMNQEMYPLQFLYPKNKKITGSLNPKLLNVKNIFLGGAFAIERQYDKYYVFVPLKFAEELTEFKNKRTSIELSVKPDFSIAELKSILQTKLGEQFEVKDTSDLHQSLYRAHKIEKLFVFLVISVILLVASINIFFALSMLVIEKKKDIAILKSMGATNQDIYRIFMFNGFIISFLGAIGGIVLGLLVVLSQQKFKFLKMGMESALVDAYPMALRATDFVFTLIVVFVISLLIAIIPAKKASLVKVSEEV